jgi:hypothetical protein
MPARRKEPEPERKRLTLEDIELGIRKLKRRIDEVKALDPTKIRYDAPEAKAATRNIKDDIRDIFGDGSQEYVTHGAHSVSYPAGVGGLNTDDGWYQGQFAVGLPKTVAMLDTLVKRLDEKREDLGSDPTSLARATFEGVDLHPRVRDVAAELFRDGHYRNAVSDAAVALVNMVKEKSRRHDLDGSGLMSTVFSKNNAVRAFNDLKDQTDRDEQEG